MDHSSLEGTDFDNSCHQKRVQGDRELFSVRRTHRAQGVWDQGLGMCACSE